jgi:hypothetical protein
VGPWSTQGNVKRLGQATTFYGTVALSFVIPSEAEGSAVPRTCPGNVFRQSVAQWRDLRFSFPPLLRSGLHRERLLVNTGLNLRDRAVIDRHLFRLSLQHKTMAHP